MAKETAEQKLLKLIETTESKDSPSGEAAQGEKGAGSQEAQDVAKSVKGLGVPSIALPSFLKNLLSLLRGSSKSPTSFSIKEINSLILIIIVILTIFLSLDVARGMKASNREFIFDVGENIAAMTEQMLPAFSELGEYVKVVSRRNIFHPYERKVVEEPEETGEPVEGQKVAKQTENLKLVGISWLNTPESASAMIENTVSGVTYFIKTGETINNVTVKTIYADSVIIGFEGEEMEMKL